MGRSTVNDPSRGNAENLEGDRYLEEQDLEEDFQAESREDAESYETRRDGGIEREMVEEDELDTGWS